MSNAAFFVVPHDPSWAKRFDREAEVLAEALGSGCQRVEHIGSTAIPTIYAKPIIDILVGVADIAAVDDRIPRMETAGYQSMGEFGISGRRYFRKHDEDGQRTHHVHVFEAGSPQIERHLAFRDYLLAHPDQAGLYSELKRRLAEAHADSMDRYMDGKDAFIKDIDRRAALWRARHPSG